MSITAVSAINTEAEEAEPSMRAIQKRLRVPPAVVRFAVRRAVDEDEVQVSWGVDFGECQDHIDSLSLTEARALHEWVGDLPECSAIVVQGLAHLSHIDQAAGRCPPGAAGPVAIKAAILCAMHHVLVERDALPVVRRKKLDVRMPMQRLPDGWRIEVDVADVAKVPRQDGEAGDPALAYGRFLWVAINGESARLAYSTSRAIKALAVAQPSSVVFINAEPNVVARVKTPLGPMLLSRHVVERACERLAGAPRPAKAAGRIQSALFGHPLFDVTAAMRSIRKRNPLLKSVQMFAQQVGGQLIMYVVRPSRHGGDATLVTAYEVPDHQREVVARAMAKGPVRANKFH